CSQFFLPLPVLSTRARLLAYLDARVPGARSREPVLDRYIAFGPAQPEKENTLHMLYGPLPPLHLQRDIPIHTREWFPAVTNVVRHLPALLVAANFYRSTRQTYQATVLSRLQDQHR